MTDHSRADLDGRVVAFARLPISLPCPVPVLPGTWRVEHDGRSASLEERTEACAVDAFWMIGSQVSCDVHLRAACRILGIDYESLVAEAGGPASVELMPWEERRRYSQEEAKQGGAWET